MPKSSARKTPTPLKRKRKPTPTKRKPAPRKTPTPAKRKPAPRKTPTKRKPAPRKTPTPTKRKPAPRKTPTPTKRKPAPRKTPTPTKRKPIARPPPPPPRKPPTYRPPPAGVFTLEDWIKATRGHHLMAGDIMGMAKGEKVHVVFMDRNLGDYLYNAHVPENKPLTARVLAKYALQGIFTSNGKGDLKGKLRWSFDPSKSEPFEFEYIVGNSWSDYGPYTAETYVGWRGPAFFYYDLLDETLPKFYFPKMQDW